MSCRPMSLACPGTQSSTRCMIFGWPRSICIYAEGRWFIACTAGAPKMSCTQMFHCIVEFATTDREYSLTSSCNWNIPDRKISTAIRIIVLSSIINITRTAMLFGPCLDPSPTCLDASCSCLCLDTTHKCLDNIDICLDPRGLV